MNWEQPDGPLTPEEEAKAALLTDSDFAEIDRLLLAKASHKWRKVAFVVGSAMSELSEHILGFRDVFFAKRVKVLVERGLLEAQGNLDYMRYSEVRLPRTSDKINQ